MSYTERLARLSYVAILMLLAGAIGFAAYRLLARPALDPRTASAGLGVETDAETGCQYVVTPWGGIFARLDSDGKPLCRAPAPKP